jgi:hypothetical protein
MKTGPPPHASLEHDKALLIGTMRQLRWPVSLIRLVPSAVAVRTSRRTPQSAGSAELPTGSCGHRRQVVASRQFPRLTPLSARLLLLRRLA